MSRGVLECIVSQLHFEKRRTLERQHIDSAAACNCAALIITLTDAISGTTRLEGAQTSKLIIINPSERYFNRSEVVARMHFRITVVISYKTGQH